MKNQYFKSGSEEKFLSSSHPKKRYFVMIIIVVVTKKTGKEIEIEAETDFSSVIIALPRLITQKIVFMERKYLNKISRCYRSRQKFNNSNKHLTTT